MRHPIFLIISSVLLTAALLGAQAVKPAPADRAEALKQAESELASGRRVEAARLLRSTADRFQSVQALLQLARIQSGDGDGAGALESLLKARAIAPNSEEVLSAYARVSLAARSLVPAIVTLGSLTRMCANVTDYHYLLGIALMQAGGMSAAVDSLQQAERLEPNRVLTLIALGMALNSRKLYGEAKPYLLRSLELETDNLEVLAALSESEEGLNELEPAEQHARRTLEAANGHATANLVIGLVLMKRERYADARDALQKGGCCGADIAEGPLSIEPRLCATGR